jgi:lysophospholipase L1-like esterase
MKKIILLVSAAVVSIAASAQSITIVQKGQEVLSVSPSTVDEIVFSMDEPTGTVASGGSQAVNGKWCSIGTSITWYNNNVSTAGGRFTRGYQDRVMDRLAFKEFANVGDNGGCIAGSVNKPVEADYYSIEHGINDWGHGVAVGTIDDYINGTNNGTFAADYRRLIDKIYSLNPKAKVVLCTPRKGCGFSGYLPAHWYDEHKGIHLEDYAKLIRQIAEYESLPVADFFSLCGGDHNLVQLSIDEALHPNDDGYQLMANVLVKAFEKIIVE